MEIHRKDEDVTKITKEYYVIKLKKEDEEYFWTETRKIMANYTKDLKLARKYKDYNSAKKMALRICEANNIVTYVTRYITSVRITYLNICLPFKSPKDSNSLTIHNNN